MYIPVSTLLVTFIGFVQCTLYQNPVLWEDLADIDVIRVNDTYYYSASSMHFSPGAPILRSFDLVNWEFAGHSVPSLDFGSELYDLIGGQAYVKGIWASFFKYRESNGLFYWGGCINFTNTYIYTASAVKGPWTQQAVLDTCYYDCGMLIDDDDTLYVSYGGSNIQVAQLAPNGFSQVSTQMVYESPADIGYIEGSRFYKINGNYYILVTHPANAEYVLMSTTGPFGPYTIKPLVDNISGPIPAAGYSHQGGIVETTAGDWYYLAFQDALPSGRVPVLAPITWGDDGFPIFDSVNGAWNTSYDYPNVPPALYTVKSPTGIEYFGGTSLGPEWEFNHNPDNTKWSINNGLSLSTATVTMDLYAARNTLTHRILGPSATATIVLDVSQMINGDRTGLALLRDSSAWIGVTRDSGIYSIVMLNNITMNTTTWDTINTGEEQAAVRAQGTQIWLQASADIAPGATTNIATFSYSFDGSSYTTLGPEFVLDTEWEFFMAYRFAIFNHATIQLGGTVNVQSFEMTSP
jgi:beta-xylosidase